MVRTVTEPKQTFKPINQSKDYWRNIQVSMLDTYDTVNDKVKHIYSDVCEIGDRVNTLSKALDNLNANQAKNNKNLQTLNDTVTEHIKQTQSYSDNIVDKLQTTSDNIVDKLQTTSDSTIDILDRILSELKKSNTKELTTEQYNLALSTVLNKLRDYEIQQLTDRKYFEVLAEILNL